MIAVVASVAVAIAGLLGTRAAVDWLARRRDALDAHAYWALGVAATVPAWLVVWLSLLPSTPGLRPQALAGAVWILSSALAFLGAITSETRLRARSDVSPDPREAWGWGVLAVVPAWIVAALGRLAGGLSG